VVDVPADIAEVVDIVKGTVETGTGVVSHGKMESSVIREEIDRDARMTMSK
jgi:hypothetical protein